jgi:hypothetical protein
MRSCRNCGNNATSCWFTVCHKDMLSGWQPRTAKTV